MSELLIDAPIPTFETAPLATPEMRVPPEWIDYNGHMNVAYYSMAFDKSSDVIFDEVLGVGGAYAEQLKMGPMILQQQIHFVGELLEGERFQCFWQLLDWDAKRLHFFGEMKNLEDGSTAAYTETMGMNVDLVKRRSAPYPDWALARIEALGKAHAPLPRPELAGSGIGIRRKG